MLQVFFLWGLPRDIVSDRDSRFTGKFWTELFKRFGSKLNLSSAAHPETDGQTERFNGMLEEYLRHFVAVNQKNWVELLDVAQLCFNSQKSSSTGKSAFEVVNGQQPLLPHTIGVAGKSRSPKAVSFSQEWKRNVEITRSQLEKAVQRMKKYADQNRRFVEFNVGDRVMVKLPSQQQNRSIRDRDPRLLQKYIGPIVILKRIGKVAYKIDPPEWWKIHPVLHVSLLKPFHEDKDEPLRSQSQRQGLNVQATGKRVAEKILADRVVRRSRKEQTEYLVKWQGRGDAENTWELAKNLKAFLPLIDEYHSTAPRASPN